MRAFQYSALLGMGVFTLSMFGFAVSDAALKALSETLPVSLILFVMSCASVLLFLTYCILMGLPLFEKTHWGALPLARALTEVGITLCTGLALAALPLSTVIALYQIAPFTIVLLGAYVSKTRVGGARFGAIAVGFVGILCVTKPFETSLDPALLLVVGALISVTVQDNITQHLPRDLPTPMIGFQAALALAFVTGLTLLMHKRASLDFHMPPMSIGLLALLCGSFFGAYSLLILATRHADLAAISVTRYARLGFALLFGIAFFGERPDGTAWVGFCLILLSGIGLFVWEHRKSAKP